MARPLRGGRVLDPACTTAAAQGGGAASPGVLVAQLAAAAREARLIAESSLSNRIRHPQPPHTAGGGLGRAPASPGAGDCADGAAPAPGHPTPRQQRAPIDPFWWVLAGGRRRRCWGPGGRLPSAVGPASCSPSICGFEGGSGRCRPMRLGRAAGLFGVVLSIAIWLLPCALLCGCRQRFDCTPRHAPSPWRLARSRAPRQLSCACLGAR